MDFAGTYEKKDQGCQKITGKIVTTMRNLTPALIILQVYVTWSWCYAG
jgi:hypothetical protein